MEVRSWKERGRREEGERKERGRREEGERRGGDEGEKEGGCSVGREPWLEREIFF